MKRTAKWIAVLVALTLSFACFACGNNDIGKGGYLDTTDRPEIDVPDTSAQLRYPEKPDEAPGKPVPGVAPTVTGYAASDADSPYTIANEGQSKRISYSDVSDWAYVYVSVQNYTPAYGNIKITLNNDPEEKGTNAALAERIAVQAVYYEAYDLGYAPVTVHAGDLTGGEQYVIADLGETMITDANYEKVAGQSVRDKTVIGFVLFIDSLPSYAPANGAAGTLDVMNFEFLQDGDPALEDRYVKPVAVLESVVTEGDLTCTYAQDALTVSGTGTAYIPLRKYSSDFTVFDLSALGTAGQSVQVGLRYAWEDETYVSPLTPAVLTGEAQQIRFDYTNLRAASGSDDLDMRLIQYADVTDIVLSFENAQNFTLSQVAFTRTATGGAYIADSWVSNASSVAIEWAYNGGNAGIAFEHHTVYSFLSVPVRKGEGIRAVAIELYAPDGIDHLGVGIVTNSPNNSEAQNKGTYILRNAKDIVKGNDTVASTTLPKEKYMRGITETVRYNAQTKIYTFTYDFSRMTPDDDEKTFADYTVTALLFYLNCPCTDAANKANHAFETPRALYFRQIELVAA